MSKELELQIIGKMLKNAKEEAIDDFIRNGEYYQGSTIEIDRITLLEKELQEISIISSPYDSCEEGCYLDELWKRKLFALKSQDENFRKVMIDVGWRQRRELRVLYGVHVSLDEEANNKAIDELYACGKIDKEQYGSYFIGISYLITDDDFIKSEIQIAGRVMKKQFEEV